MRGRLTVLPETEKGARPVRTVVSRGAVYLTDGRKACSRCKRRARLPRQRYCRICRAAYRREWREGKVEVLLTPEEWTAVKEARKLQASGKHARQ